MHLLALLCLFPQRNDRFPYPLINFNYWNPYPYTWGLKRYSFWAEPPRIGHYRKYSRGCDSVPRSPAGIRCPRKSINLSREGTIQRATLLVGSTNFFLHINTLPLSAWATRSRRDNQSMRERWFRQSQHARALFTWAKGSDFSSHINARLSSMTRLGGWPFNPGQVLSI